MSLPSKTQVWNEDYPSIVTIMGRGKDHTQNGLGDSFEDLWFKDLIHAQAVSVRADRLATLSDRCTHATTQATNMAQIKAEGTRRLTHRVSWPGWGLVECGGRQMSCQACG
jgi:hypothetical protein